jgi:hypothetical protein
MGNPDTTQSCPPNTRDITCGSTGLLIWGVPIVLLVVTANLGGIYALVSWPPLLVFMGGACLLNARRCGRLHCYITGPFFLLLAVLSLLYGLGLLPLGPRGWPWLVNALLIGSLVLCCVPEWLFGRYVRKAPTGTP